jgi:hypothetical protein
LVRILADNITNISTIFSKWGWLWLGYFSNVLKMTFNKDEFGFIAGSMKSKAAMMYKRGSTRVEVEEATGYARLVVLKELREMGYKIIKKKVRVGKNRPHFLYTIGGKNERDSSC